MRRIFLLLFLYSSLSFAQSKIFSLMDKESHEVLAFANIYTNNFGTISNADGDFELDLSRIDSDIKISYIGYKDLSVSVADLLKKDVIYLERKTEVLEEIVLQSIDDILRKIMENLSVNYPDEAINELFFYRATLLKNEVEGQLNEGFIKANRTRYFKNVEDDNYEILSVLKQNDLEELNYRYMSFHRIFELSNGFIALGGGAYEFTTVYLDENLMKINFIPKENISVSHPLFDGYLIVDTSNYAIVEMNYSMNEAYKKTISERKVFKSISILDNDAGKIIKWEKGSKTEKYLLTYMLLKEGVILINKKNGTRDQLKVYYELQKMPDFDESILPSREMKARKNRSIFQYRDFNTESPLWKLTKPLLRNKEQNIIIENIE